VSVRRPASVKVRGVSGPLPTRLWCQGGWLRFLRPVVEVASERAFDAAFGFRAQVWPGRSPRPSMTALAMSTSLRLALREWLRSSYPVDESLDCV
jgi:hypothetical protein